MVAGSRLNYLDVWSIETKSHVKKIQLIESTKQSDSSSSTGIIKDCLVLPGYCYDNKIVIVLTVEGRLDVYSLERAQHVATLSSSSFAHNHSQVINEQRLTQIVSPTSTARFFCALSQDGCIQVFDLDCSLIKTMKVIELIN